MERSAPDIDLSIDQWLIRSPVDRRVDRYRARRLDILIEILQHRQVDGAVHAQVERGPRLEADRARKRDVGGRSGEVRAGHGQQRFLERYHDRSFVTQCEPLVYAALLAGLGRINLDF